MLIVSKHKDYYDGIFAGAPDKSIVYNRTYKELNDQNLISSGRRKWNQNIKQFKYEFYLATYTENLSKDWRRDYNEWELCLLGFCGKTKVIARWRHKSAVEWNYVYDKQSIIDAFCTKDRYYYSYNKEKIENIFIEWDDKLNYDIFRELEAPVFLFSYEKGDPTITVNPILKDLGFSNRMDAFTASQEIYMFVDTQLRPKEDTIEISDEDKAKSRGFHDMSFKNRGKKPKRRKHRK